MVSTQQIMISLTLYFVFALLFLAAITPAVEKQTSVTVNIEKMGLGSSNVNASADWDIPDSASVWNFGSYLSVLTQFFVWGESDTVNLGLSGISGFIVRMLFVWLPMALLFYTILSLVRGI